MLLLLGAAAPAAGGGVKEETPDGTPRPPRAQGRDHVEVNSRLKWLMERDEATAEARAAVQKRFANFTSWKLQPCEHYFLVSNSKDPEFLEGTRRRLAAVRARLVREFPPRTPIGGVNQHSLTLVLALRDRRSHASYGEVGSGTLAYYSLRRNQMGFHDVEPAQRDSITWPAMQGMTAMAYMEQLAGENRDALPEWIVQGVGGLFQERALGGDGRWEELTNEKHHAGFVADFLANRQLSLVELWNLDRHRFSTAGSSTISPGAANRFLAGMLLRFLSCDGAGTVVWDPRWGRIVTRYVDAVQDGEPAQACQTYALDGCDLDELEIGWRIWLELRIDRDEALPD